MHISTTNSKLGGFIPSINLPIEGTCRADAPCKKECYANKGHWLYPKVKESLQQNLLEFYQDSEKFFNDIISYLNDSDVIYKYFRWFGSGDIVNYNFFLGMVEVAKKTPQTRFLCFTKKFSIVNKYLLENELPSNLQVVFSGWNIFFKIDNPFNLPVTYVNFRNVSNNVKSNENDKVCTSQCKDSKKCWYLKQGERLFFTQH